MTKKLRPIKSVLVPIDPASNGEQLLAIAKAISLEIILVGVVPIEEGQPVSTGVQAARAIRKRLMALDDETTRYKSSVIVSATPWKDLQQVIANEEPDLLLAEWEDGLITFGVTSSELLSNPPCNVAIVRPSGQVKFDKTLITVRGGPHAELALQLGMSIHPPQLDLLHIALTGAASDAPFKGIQHILRQLPEVHPRSITTDDAVRTISEEAQAYDTVILGASASKLTGSSQLGPVSEKLLREASATVIILKSQRPMSESMIDESVGAQAISILVDKWFAENTFHADEFSDLKQLLALKEKQGSTISLALPALNEEETVANVIRTVKKALMDKVPLIDEIILIDSNSTDKTRSIAEKLGIPVYIHQQLLPELGARCGKGEALWKSLLVTKGDIIAWIDTDIINIHPRFVYGVIGPLLLNRDIQLVKGFYRRPLKVGDKVQAGGGGRVTELAARPLLNLFYPELSGVIQPLSGEYAGRREALEQAVFFSGYGVETGLLIDVFERYDLRSIAQVDLLERIHRNQALEALGKMSFAIIQTVLRKLEARYERAIIEDVNKTMKLIRYANGEYFLDVEEVAERERPPMISVPAYLERSKK